MENEKLEFFKLNAIDRKVLFWLMDHVHTRNLLSWTEYIAREYLEKGINIDTIKLYNETQQREGV
jgi:hypothetical protein